MIPPSARRSLWVFPLALGAVVWTACGSNSGGQSSDSFSQTAAPVAGDFGKNPAPGFSLQDTNGKTVSLADFKGKVVFLDFWATWCPPCRISMPDVEKLHRHFQGKPVQVLGLNLDENPEKVKRFVEQKKIPYPVLLAGDSDVARSYGVGGIPHFVLIDQDGRLVNDWSGYAPEFAGNWRALINQLLGA
ncbi:MAG: redoxin domain-containing protein [Elusimicrobia bacterium]|nr:redoxin domain-containing protein [Elusimicrobiota bacterium]